MSHEEEEECKQREKSKLPSTDWLCNADFPNQVVDNVKKLKMYGR